MGRWRPGVTRLITFFMATIIDSVPSDWASSSSSESEWDSGDDDDEYSDNRVEDEDWERAEGGQ